MTYFILGIITGALLMLGAVVGGMAKYLTLRQPNTFISRVKNYSSGRVKGAIIPPPDARQKAVEELLDTNDRKGVDTPLEAIYEAQGQQQMQTEE